MELEVDLSGVWRFIRLEAGTRKGKHVRFSATSIMHGLAFGMGIGGLAKQSGRTLGMIYCLHYDFIMERG